MWCCSARGGGCGTGDATVLLLCQEVGTPEYCCSARGRYPLYAAVVPEVGVPATAVVPEVPLTVLLLVLAKQRGIELCTCCNGTADAQTRHWDLFSDSGQGCMTASTNSTHCLMFSYQENCINALCACFTWIVDCNCTAGLGRDCWPLWGSVSLGKAVSHRTSQHEKPKTKHSVTFTNNHVVTLT
jgi:hypothetical protein